MVDAVLLAGGRGKRMAAQVPKALVKVAGIEILAHQINFLRKNNVQRIILSIGHQANLIQEYIRRSAHQNIFFAVEETPLGTAGGLKKALEFVLSPFILVLNADNLANVDVQRLKKHRENTIVVCQRHSPYGKVAVDAQGYAVFEEKPILEHWTNGGWYLFKKTDLKKCLPAQGSLEYDVLPTLKMRLFYHEGFLKSLNSLKDVEELEKEIKEGKINLY